MLQRFWKKLSTDKSQKRLNFMALRSILISHNKTYLKYHFRHFATQCKLKISICDQIKFASYMRRFWIRKCREKGRDLFTTLADTNLRKDRISDVLNKISPKLPVYPFRMMISIALRALKIEARSQGNQQIGCRQMVNVLVK